MTEKRLYIGGLFAGVTEADITERFSKFGDVKDVDIKVRNPDDGIAFCNNLMVVMVDFITVI